MTKANNLASLLDANGDVVSSALDNVPASNDASALSTGTLPDGRFPSTLPAISGANLTNLPSSGGISNVVEDTSPQLGANLQSNGHDIQMADGDELRIGNSDDIRIYHSTSGGGQNFIQTGTSGELYIKAGSVDIIANGINSSAIQMTTAGEVNLLHAGGTKIQTQSDGAKVLGNIVATGTVTASGDIIRNDTTTGTSKFALQYSGSDAAVFKRNNATGVATISNGYAGSPVDAINISLVGNVGIGGTPSYKLHVQSSDTNAVARITNTGSTDANVNSIFQLATASNVAQSLVNEANNYSQFSHSGDLTFHYDDVDTHVFRTKNGTEKARIRQNGGIFSNRTNLDGTYTGLFTNYSNQTLADEAYFTIATNGTAGGGLLAVYETGSGQSALFHFGYNRSNIVSGNTSVFANTDTDGRICLLSSGHSLYLKNRQGMSRTYATCLHTAGFS